MLKFRKSCTILLCIIPIMANATVSIAQSVIFKGFPGDVTYKNYKNLSSKKNKSKIQAAVAIDNKNSLQSDTNKIVYYFPIHFPPIDPINFSNDKYNMTCDLGDDDDCGALFTTIIYSGGQEICTYVVDLYISKKPNREIGKNHKQVISGNCTTSTDGDREGDTTLWVVKPK